jgi:hypothetical protein
MTTSSFALLLVLNPSSNTYGSIEILGQHQQQQHGFVPGTKMDRFWKERVQIDFGGSDCEL